MKLSRIALCCIALCFTSSVAFCQNPFMDVPKDHWSYAALAGLQSSGLLRGYPGSEFSGFKTLTRYEITFALKRAIDVMEKSSHSASGASGSGSDGQSNVRVTASDVVSMTKLVREFGSGLVDLGADINRTNLLLSDYQKITGSGNVRPNVNATDKFYSQKVNIGSY